MTTTSDAAEFVGVRYETLRNWLKKGLLVDRRISAASAGRKWRHYSDVDMVCLQITRNALDVGVPLEIVVDICNDSELLELIDADLTGRYRLGGGPQVFILVWSQADAARFMIVAETAVVTEIKRHPSAVTILNLSHIIRQTAARLDR